MQCCLHPSHIVGLSFIALSLLLIACEYNYSIWNIVLWTSCLHHNQNRVLLGTRLIFNKMLSLLMGRVFLHILSACRVCRTTFHLQRFRSGPTTGWWSGFDLWTSLNMLPTCEAAVSTEASWWGGFYFPVKTFSSYTDLLLIRSAPCSGSGATVQRGDHGAAAEHAPQQDSAAPPPRHTFQSVDRPRGPATQTGVPRKPGLHFAYSYHKSQGNLLLLESR